MELKPETYCAEQMYAEESRQERMEIHQTQIDELAKELLTEGQECFPFSVDNIEEALRNMSDTDKYHLAAYVRSAHKLPNNEFMGWFCSKAFLDYIREYWEKRAPDFASEQFRNR